ncbi:UNVERIFIED_CONTAM: hypothetical protein GTU68_043777 [Idotea baltica]|nr:hypothetical protein [Idotea baltica]
MDFSWPAEYVEYRNKVVKFAQDNLNDDVVTRDHQGVFPYDLWKACGEFGIQAMAAPAEFGGPKEEVDILRSVLAMEGLGYGCKDNGLGIALNAHMWAVQMSVVLFGTDAQKQKFLPKMISGEWIGAHGLTEKNSGSDVFNMQMTAEKVEGGYILNGEKRLVTLAPIADMAVCFANVNPKLGKWGVTAFLLEKGMDGFTSSPSRNKMGLRTVPLGELTLKDCFVPEENRLGKEGAGFSISNHSLEYDRCCILAAKLGAMDRQLEEAIAFANEREQFGQPVGKFQSVSNRIADMKLRLETSRLLLYKLAWLKKEGKPAMMEAAMLKLHLGESFVSSSLDAIRTHGGNGYLTDFETERNLRDAIGGVLYAGTSDIQRNIIARLLGV